jgi:hypothetical protein
MRDHIQKEKGGSNPLPNHRKPSINISRRFPQEDNWRSFGDLVSVILEDSFAKSVENIGSKRYAK